VFTSVEKTPVVASYNLLTASDTAYNTPDDVLNPTSESSSPPTGPPYDPVSMEEHILKSNSGPKSPVEEYDKLAHLSNSQGMYVVSVGTKRISHRSIPMYVHAWLLNTI